MRVSLKLRIVPEQDQLLRERTRLANEDSLVLLPYPAEEISGRDGIVAAEEARKQVYGAVEGGLRLSSRNGGFLRQPSIEWMEVWGERREGTHETAALVRCLGEKTHSYVHLINALDIISN